MERKIRADKRTQEALEAAGDTEGAKAVKKRISAENKALRAYCDKEGLTYRQDRTQIYGYTDISRKKKTVDFVEIVKQNNSEFPQNINKNLSATVISETIIKVPDIAKEKESLYSAISTAEEDFALLPDKHRLIVKKALKSVELSKNGISGYSPSRKALVLSEHIEKGDTIHEAGHIIFHEMDLEKSSKYQKTLCKGIENLKNYDIMENRDYQQSFYCIGSEKFINPYQGRVYIDMDNIDYSADLDYSLLKEYFAEGYRAYFYEPDVLKNKDVDLFNYIKDLVNEDG